MKGNLLKTLVLLVLVSLGAGCWLLKEEMPETISLVNKAISKETLPGYGVNYFYIGTLNGGEAVVMRIPTIGIDGASDEYFAFFVADGEVYPVNKAAYGIMVRSPLTAAPVRLQEVLHAIDDLPPDVMLKIAE